MFGSATPRPVAKPPLPGEEEEPRAEDNEPADVVEWPLPLGVLSNWASRTVPRTCPSGFEGEPPVAWPEALEPKALVTLVSFWPFAGLLPSKPLGEEPVGVTVVGPAVEVAGVAMARLEVAGPLSPCAATAPGLMEAFAPATEPGAPLPPAGVGFTARLLPIA